MVSFQIKRLQLEKSNNLQLLVEKFIVYNLSVPHKHEILDLKYNFVYVIHDREECSQGVVKCYICLACGLQQICLVLLFELLTFWNMD
jgi:hypothetical protein